ncbi:MAG: DNA mismatch repair protein MutS [Nitrososphaerota archaeon]|nr:DNA mismatch repair protein MutS [Nitrososphaerota archaeon]
MTFRSILFEANHDKEESGTEVPTFFKDLNLDQIFQAIISGREEYNLRAYFWDPLNDVDGITYRHEILQDLEKQPLREAVKSFAQKMRDTRQHLAQADKLHYEYQKASWFLDAVAIYCNAVRDLASQLSQLDIGSTGFLELREYLASYVKSEIFMSLVAETQNLLEQLSSITYSVLIQGKRVTVGKYKGEPDYSTEVLETFQKFQQGAVKNYLVIFREPVDMNHIEAGVLDQVAKLYSEIFAGLHEYYNLKQDYLDPTIRRFDREVQFYLAYLEFIEKFKKVGLKFCYPDISERSKEVYASETFDIALANKLISNEQSAPVVCNDFYLKGPERIFVVSGPNQGGKTTFARMFGQLHYLAKLGYLVPGREAQLFLSDEIFTHFEKEEHIENLRGKLQDELVRIHEILQQATSKSIVIVNESFASTTLNDAIFLGKEVLQQIIQRDLLCVYVTFIDELSTLSKATVSMVSTVVPENPAMRTFKILRKPADGRAYAIAIAEKYGLGYESLRRRIAH